jgi:hypothetical protein
MAVLEDLSEEERFLVSILLDESGVDQAEFLWVDERNPDNLFRCYDYQYGWYRTKDKLQIDQCGRAIGKSIGIQLRAFAFAFTNPAEELLITAPELIHLDPVTKYIEERLVSTRLTRDFLNTRGGQRGITKRPFEAKFLNGAKIIGRIPQKDGKGIKGSIADGCLIATETGMIPVEDIQVGALVMTHEGRFRPVLTIHSYEADTVVVPGAGHKGIAVSENHRFWGRRNSNPQRTRNLSHPTWLVVDDAEFGKRWYWASPSQFPEVEMPDLPCNEADVRSFMWLLGRWVADGVVWGKKVNGVASTAGIIVKESEFASLAAMVAMVGLDPKRHAHDNAACVRFYAPSFTQFAVNHFGKRAEGKRLPMWLLGASKIVRDAFLDGYLSGDGCWVEEKRRWQASTASKELAVGLKLLGQSLGFSSSFSWVDPKVTHIGGVELKKAPQRSWRVHFKEDGRGQFDDGFVWQKMRAPEPGGVRMVYDLVVAEDFSYIADGIVHKGSSVMEGES